MAVVLSESCENDTWLGGGGSVISHVHKCVFVHVPKCGGSSVEQAFLADLSMSYGMRATLLLRSRIQDELGPPSLTHLTAEEYVRLGHLSAELFGRYYKFSLVREPVGRAMSAYNYLGARYLMSPDRFVDQVIAPAVESVDHGLHWFLRPQWKFVSGVEGLLVDDVFHLEAIGEDFARVAQKVGLGLTQLPHENVSSQRPTGSPLRAGARAWIRFGMRPGLDRGRKFSAKSIARLHELYADDYLHLGYAVV